MAKTLAWAIVGLLSALLQAASARGVRLSSPQTAAVAQPTKAVKPGAGSGGESDGAAAPVRHLVQLREQPGLQLFAPQRAWGTALTVTPARGCGCLSSCVSRRAAAVDTPRQP